MHLSLLYLFLDFEGQFCPCLLVLPTKPPALAHTSPKGVFVIDTVTRLVASQCECPGIVLGAADEVGVAGLDGAALVARPSATCAALSRMPVVADAGGVEVPAPEA